jgi:predicted TIM-barrel fold metal-dependent hydrolase
VRICGEWKYRMLIDDPRCLELFRKAGKLKCPVVLHLDVPFCADPETGQSTYQPSWYGGTIDNLSRALEACPETIFIGHAPGFWREMSGDAAEDPENYPQGPVTPGGSLYDLFDRHENIWADLSAGSALYALSRAPDNAVQFLTRYADRLLFGRDNYGTALHDFMQTIELPDDVRSKVYSENAQKLVSNKNLLSPIPRRTRLGRHQEPPVSG